MRGINSGITLTDKSTFEELFGRYFPRLYAFALKLLQDNVVAEDIVQNAFVSVWEKHESVSLNTLENYLFVSVRNGCLNELKRKSIHQKKLDHLKNSLWLEEIYRIDFLKDMPCVLIENELKREVEKLIEELPPRCREVFRLSREKGLKNREIAEKLGISIKNVERHISSALQKFKVKFGAELGVVLFVTWI